MARVLAVKNRREMKLLGKAGRGCASPKLRLEAATFASFSHAFSIIYIVVLKISRCICVAVSQQEAG